MGNIDHDAVLRARVLLLGSGRLGLWEEIGAYRVLAEVSPRAYLPKLVGALISKGLDAREDGTGLALLAEAVAAARRLAACLPEGSDRLRRALYSYQWALFAAGRRGEGRAACEELAEMGAYERLALVLAEEGRHAEAAALYGRHVEGAGQDASDWTLIEWAAELDAAGLHERSLEVFGRLVDGARSGAAQDRVPWATLVWDLVHHAGMLEAAGALAGAAAARQEALGVLGRLVQGGEPRSWGDIQPGWITLFALSGRRDEPAATPDAPLPPFGAHVFHFVFHAWSPDTRDAWFASVGDLERRAAALRESGDLPELVTVHRRLTVRRAGRWQRTAGRDVESLLPEFDEGVTLARRLPGLPSAVARALTDRAMFLLAARRYEEARRDFAEAVALLDGPVSSISHPTSPK